MSAKNLRGGEAKGVDNLENNVYMECDEYEDMVGIVD